MNWTRIIWRKGWIHPFLQMVLLQSSYRGKELNKFCPPDSSDDVCLFFCITPLLWTSLYVYRLLKLWKINKFLYTVELYRLNFLHRIYDAETSSQVQILNASSLSTKKLKEEKIGIIKEILMKPSFKLHDKNVEEFFTVARYFNIF